MDKLFLSRILKILRILVPRFFCMEVWKQMPENPPSKCKYMKIYGRVVTPEGEQSLVFLLVLLMDS